MTSFLFAALLLLAIPLGAFAAWRIVRRPAFGFLVLAVLAPVSNLLTVGPVKSVYLVGFLIMIGVGLRFALRPEFGIPRVIAFHVVAILGLMTYAWTLGGFEATQQYVGLVGSLAVVAALLLVDMRRDEVDEWLWLFAASIAVSDVVFAVLVMAVPSLRPVLLDVASEGVRLQGTMGNPNMFGGAQVLALSALSYLALNASSPVRRLLAWPGAMVVFGALLVSQSRSAIVGIFLGVGFVALVRFTISRHRMRTLAYGSAALVAMALVVVNLPPEIGGLRLSRVAASDEADSRLIYDVGGANLAQDRLYLYSAAVRTIQRYPYGIGYREDPDQVIGKVSGTYKGPHNYLLSEILNYGVLGGLYVILLWSVPPLYVARELWRGRVGAGSVSTFLLVGMIAYLVHALFHSMTNWIYLWIFWGLAIKSVRLERQARQGTARRPPYAAAS